MHAQSTQNVILMLKRWDDCFVLILYSPSYPLMTITSKAVCCCCVFSDLAVLRESCHCFVNPQKIHKPAT